MSKRQSHTRATAPAGPGAIPSGGGSDTFVEAFARGLAVMGAFTGAGPSLTITEVAARASVTRAGARRLLHTLVALGYARLSEGSFSLTPKVLDLGHAYLSSLSLREIAQPVIERLAGQVDEIVGVSVLDGDEIVFVARAERRSPLSRGIGIGGRLPAFATSMGRVLLAALPPEQAESVLARRKLKAYTKLTRCTREAVLRDLALVRRKGYSLVSEELELGVCGVAAAIHDGAGRVVAAMNVSTNLARHSRDSMVHNLLPRLIAAADEISAALKAGR